MRRNLVILFLCAAIITLLIVAGCAPSQQPIQTIQPPAQCNTVYVVSNCFDCTGTIFVNGLGTGVFLAPWGAATVTVPNLQCGQIVSVYLQHPLGIVSHSVTTNATSPQTVITFDWL